MSRLKWDEQGTRLYETGIDHVIVFPRRTQNGVPWNGVTSITETGSGSEPSAIYADNIKYLNLMSPEEFSVTIEAYTYPKQFTECLGEVELATGIIIAQQPRKHFGLAYRTKVGNDTEGQDYGEKLHLIFDCLAAPSDKAYQTTSDSPEAVTFSWEISTTPVTISPANKATATMTIESTAFKKAGWMNYYHKIEDILYGTASTSSRMPTATELIALKEPAIYLRDADGGYLQDSGGSKIMSRVFV